MTLIHPIAAGRPLSRAPILAAVVGSLVLLTLGPRLRAQDAEPSLPELWQQAAALGAAGQWAQAAEVWLQILELAPDSQQAAVSLGVCWFKAGQIE